MDQVHSLVTEARKRLAEDDLAAEKESETMASAILIGGEMWRFRRHDDVDSTEVSAKLDRRVGEAQVYLKCECVLQSGGGTSLAEVRKCTAWV